jgi:hypothetical protein
MGTLIQLVSGIYLIVVWTIFAIAVSELPPSMVGTAQDAVLLLIAIGLSIPALILFGFAQLLGDNRAVRSNIRIQSDRLKTMRTYHESRGP